MRRLSRVSKILVAVVISVLTIVATTTNVKAAAETIELGSASPVKSYIAGVTFDYKVTTDGKYLYCVNMPKKTSQNVKANLVRNSKYVNGGMLYILENGYPNKSITGDSDKDYYITQTAVWWYLDKTIGTGYLGEQFKQNGSDAYGLRKYVKQLVEEGYNHRNDPITTKESKLVINVDGTEEMTLQDGYYISNSIKATTKENISNYTVTLSNAPTATKVVLSNGTETTYDGAFTVNANESFKVKVPLSSIKSTELSLKVNATTNATTGYMMYEYQPVDTSMQNVIMSEKISQKTSSSVTLNISASRVSITKIDSVTKQPIAGAKLVLKDASGEVIASWTSTTNAHIIRNLKNGTYTVEETSSPAGYLLNKNVSKFTITDTNRDVKVRFENSPKKVVVNITKIDQETKLPLAGAVLVVRDSTGKEVARFTTKAESEVLTDLANGTYTVEEESAPAGYIKSNEKQTFTIDDEHLSHQITFVNAKEVYVPNTSSAATTTIIMLILGIGITSLGIKFIKKNAR